MSGGLLIVAVIVGLVTGATSVWFFFGRHKITQAELDELRAQKVAAETKRDALAEENLGLKAHHEALLKERETLREQAIATETQRQSLQERLEQQQHDLQEAKKQLTLHFENLANEIFQKNSTVFKSEAQQSIQTLLSPLREHLGEFQKQVRESFGSQAKEQFSLRKEIERIVGVNEKMTLQTESLTKALRGDNKVQGNWGEVILERILEDSGLRKDQDYYLQGSGLKMKHVEDGRSLKPDVVVKLPEEKHIIIDSKVSLVDYERFCSTDDEELQGQHLRAFLESIKRHVTGLEKRRYQDVDNIGSPDLVLMFMPIEGAYALAIQKDRELHPFAWSRRIAIVCPSTLLITLKTIHSVWRLEMQAQNHQEIAERGGKLYDKIAGFLEDMSRLGTTLNSAQTTYTNAMNKLSEGKGNIVRQAEMLREIGAKNSKTIPKELLEDDSSTPLEEVTLLKSSGQ